MPPLLEVAGLTVHYAAKDGAPAVALDDVDLTVDEGETVGLLGESGCGKTTLVLAIAGLLPAAARVVRGSVRFRGRELLDMPERERRRLRGADVAVVLQDPALALNPVLRVGFQVEEVLRAHRPWPQRQRRQRTGAVLAQVGLADVPGLPSAYPHQLSGGQRQRVALAQALACEPVLLLADEPTASLDSVTQAEVRRLLNELKCRMGLAVLLVSHDLGTLAALAARVCVMYAGQVVETASAARFFREPLHPYSRALLAAAPRPGSAAQAIAAIAGAPPDLAAIPSGCSFEPRCPDRFDACAVGRPPTVQPDAARRVRCFKYGG